MGIYGGFGGDIWIMEKKMESTIVQWGLYRSYFGKVEKKMETMS